MNASDVTCANNFAEGTPDERPTAVAKKTLKVLKRPTLLREMAATLEQEASRLKNEADQIEERAGSRERQEHRTWCIRKAAEAYARTGDMDAQVAYLNRALEPRSNWQMTIRSEGDRWRYIHKIVRNRELMRLARRGWTNADLSARFQLTEQHVSRIISVALGRKRHL